MKITDLRYMVKRWDFNTEQFEDFNVFNCSGVLRSVALWTKATKSKKKSVNDAYLLAKYTTEKDKLMFLFGNLWGRCEYEFIVKGGKLVGGLFEGVEGDKSDVFQYYVKPNARKLLKMVDEVSLSSATRYLAEEKRLWQR